MLQPEDGRQEVEELRERLSRLSEASLHINESLDFDTVLQGVLDSARTLTGARYGVISALDESGELQDFLTSGLTAEEHEIVAKFTDGLALFEHFSRMEGPLRAGSITDYVRAAGLPELQLPVTVTSILFAPIRNRGEQVGTVYLGKGESGTEFSQEDEETLVMFTVQAGMAIANARRHRDEQLARANLETLVETSPVGVAVFDAGTGEPALVNGEARRIVSYLLSPGQSSVELLNVATVRRADGSEIALDRLSLIQALGIGETVRDEEILLEVPDGRTSTWLVNSTPIRSADGDVESVVVTVQDMKPLKELERLRAEFLAIVGHELRTPLTSIKGSATTLLESASSLDPAEMVQFHRIISEQADHMRELISDLIDVARIETGALTVRPELADVSRLVDEGRNTFLAAGGRDNIHIYLEEDLPPVHADSRRIVQVINNLLSNASRHSHETSTIRVNATRSGDQVAVTVADDGRGLAADRLPYLFRKFSQMEGQERERDLGLGLAICKGIVEAHGGRIWAESDGPGLGSRFTFTIPVYDEAAVAPDGSAALSSGSSRGSRGIARPRILAVDDDPWTLKNLRDVLSGAGYDPIVTGNPEEVLSLIEDNDPDVVLLDLMLPGVDGIDLLREILNGRELPVIFVSAYSQDEVIARAFEAGAVDYIVKPFSSTELAARVRAALRKKPEVSRTYAFEELSIDFGERSVNLAGNLVSLTATEYRLLAELAMNSGTTLTHEQLLQRVWGPEKSGDARPMRTAMKGLRRKLGDDAGNPRYIFTVPRMGYRMARSEQQ